MGTRTEFPLRFQITSIYGNTYRKARRRGTSPPNVTFFAKAAGPRVRQESSGRAPGLLQAPSSCRDSRGWTPISGRGLGTATTSALTGSQAGPGFGLRLPGDVGGAAPRGALRVRAGLPAPRSRSDPPSWVLALEPRTHFKRMCRNQRCRGPGPPWRAH